MSINQAIVGAIVVAALAATQAASAQSRPAAPAASSPAKPAAALAIAPEADRALKEVGAYIGSASQFVFHADLTFDHVLPSGQKLQFSAAEEIVYSALANSMSNGTATSAPGNSGMTASR